MAKSIAFDVGFAPVEETGGHKREGIFRRLFKALEASRQRAAEREIERWLRTSGGGRMTDDLEREIGRRLGQL